MRLPHNIATIKNTEAWARLSRQVRHEEPECWLKLPGCRGKSTTMDHVLPMQTHPHLALVRSNVRGACKWCNDHRQETPVSQLPALRRAMQARLEAGALKGAIPRRPGKPPALALFPRHRGASHDNPAARQTPRNRQQTT